MSRSNAISVLIWLSFTPRSSEALNSSGPLGPVINPQVQRESGLLEIWDSPPRPCFPSASSHIRDE